MFTINREEIEWGGRKLVLESGRIARQADGAVLATYGETVVLATAVGETEPKPGIDFFPLTVNYQEKFYAAGKIPGGYFKREGRPTERETLISRLIDRPFGRSSCRLPQRNPGRRHGLKPRPGERARCRRHGGGVRGLTLSGIPFMGPIGAARVGYIAGEYKLNPQIDEMTNSDLDLVVAGTADAVLMVESEAKELSEETMLGAVMFGHREMQKVIDAIIRLAEKAAKEPRDVKTAEYERELAMLCASCRRRAQGRLSGRRKAERHDRIDAIKDEAAAVLVSEEEGRIHPNLFGKLFKELESRVMRGAVIDTGFRIDGRDLKTVRPIVTQVGRAARAHGSALFTRGETQALVVATLGTGEDEQFVDSLEGTYKQHFMLHYNFPPYSVRRSGPHDGRRTARDRPRASLPGAPSIRCCRQDHRSPTPFAWCPRSPSPTGRRRWPQYAARPSP
jgi:polyribonucleotide nucleotidyltransferase